MRTYFYKVVLVDIDGTVCDIDGRDSMSRNPRAVFWDRPQRHVISLVNSLQATGHTIVFVSGRPECLREVTEEWLERHWLLPREEGRTYIRLLMRADDDWRADEQIKADILSWLRAGGIEPYMAIDDRPKVIRTWQAAGIPVVQVGRAVGVGGDF